MMDPNEEESNKTMFARFQQHNHQQYHHQVHQHLSQEHQIQLEEDDDHESRSTSIGGAGGAQGTTLKIRKKEPDETNIATTIGGGDEATIEVVRRPRGRPPGSRNKPKPQVVFVSDPMYTNNSSMMQPLILEVPSGVDIVETIARYVRRRNIGVCVLTGSGTVSNVSLYDSSTALGANVVTFHGIFDILSVSATFHPPPSPSLQSSLATKTVPFSITLSGSHGQIVGGSVVGPLLAATTVTLITASFTTLSYHRLPIEEDKVEVPPSSVMSDRSVLYQHHPPHQPEASRTTSEESHPPPTESQDMAIHNWHLPSGVIWAPTAKPPLSPPPQPPRF